MRVVIDANVYVSALISSKGAPARIIEHWLQGKFDVLISEAIVAEIVRVTAYEKLQKYARLRENRLEFVQLLADQAVWVELQEMFSVVEQDESDNRYVECAVAGNAQYLVSGNPHLLQVGEYQGIRFVSPAVFETLLESENLWAKAVILGTEAFEEIVGLGDYAELEEHPDWSEEQVDAEARRLVYGAHEAP